MNNQNRPPKRLYVRLIENGSKFSIGEYINAKWRNIVDPFKLDDRAAIQSLVARVALYQQRVGREVVFVDYSNGAAKLLGQKFEVTP